ncbi:hypothetical protein FHR92_002089 [Fontibacillus solani]|uniref:PsbP C-terminal domain-containing protein n=1 Tax=Fontibacillus solani TaxID=1572857 RepID=A0A7W3XRG3_9BACL|nr:hypothetical protein [Fontibacillus solani]MBA9085622.1 hypothetical protein [Fontibacillus solani]
MSKKKIGLLTVILVLTMALVTACGGTKKEISLGTTTNGSYTNDYFGVSLSFPNEWTFQNEAALKQLMEESREIIAGDDESKKKQLDLASIKTLNLLMASQYPLDSGQLGPSVVIVAEKVSLLQGVKTGKDYLEASKKFMIDSQLPYNYKDITTAKVGGKDMDMMQITIENGDMVITQDYYCSIIDGYAYNMIFTYADDEMKAETDKIVQSVSFK